MAKKLSNLLHLPKWLFVLLAAVLILRIPSFFLPYSYGDELIYLSLGEAIRQGIPLYSGIHDNKPPLLYITAAIAGNLFWFKAILAFWSLGTIYVFWKLSEVLLPKKLMAQKLATAIFAILTTIPLLEGHIANAENFMIGPIMLGFYLLLKTKPTNKNLFISGLLFSIAALYKIPAAFDIPAIIFYWIVIQKRLDKASIVKIAKRTGMLMLGFMLPIAITFIWYYFRGAFKEYLIAAFLQNFGYLSSWRPSDEQKPFLEKNGPLLIRGTVVAIAGMILFIKKNKVSQQFLFTTIWLFLTLFAVALSERPYPHYLLQSAAPISILLTILFTSNRMEQVYSIIPLFFVFLVPYYFHFWHYETLSYYQRFINLATNKISTEEYIDSFGGQILSNYKISQYVASLTKPHEKVFVWGDGVAIYAISKRHPPIKYVADYHIKDFSSNEEVLTQLTNNMPSLIVVLPNSNPFPELNMFIVGNYGQTDSVDDAEIWKLLSPQVRSLLSY
jgi:4-amino-4-deoxy-L-arabinose transferase-like glycosyltransferase